MNMPLTSSTDLQARKELTRLRMEMHRQQVRYHAQPLCSPMAHVKGLIGLRHSHQASDGGKGPVLLAATALLALFGRRLGKIGTVARLGLTLYPLIKAQRKLRQPS